MFRRLPVDAIHINCALAGLWYALGDEGSIAIGDVCVWHACRDLQRYYTRNWWAGLE